MELVKLSEAKVSAELNVSDCYLQIKVETSRILTFGGDMDSKATLLEQLKLLHQQINAKDGEVAKKLIEWGTNRMTCGHVTNHSLRGKRNVPHGDASKTSVTGHLCNATRNVGLSIRLPEVLITEPGKQAEQMNAFIKVVRQLCANVLAQQFRDYARVVELRLTAATAEELGVTDDIDVEFTLD